MYRRMIIIGIVTVNNIHNNNNNNNNNNDFFFLQVSAEVSIAICSVYLLFGMSLLVMTFNLGIIVERLGGIETGHRELLEWIDRWISR